MVLFGSLCMGCVRKPPALLRKSAPFRYEPSTNFDLLHHQIPLGQTGLHTNSSILGGEWVGNLRVATAAIARESSNGCMLQHFCVTKRKGLACSIVE